MKVEIKQGEWLTAGAAAERAGVSREAIGKAIRDGRLPAELAGRKTYLVKTQDVDAWMQTRKARPPPAP